MLLAEVTLDRRRFLSASLATSAVALASDASAQAAAAQGREFYQLRRYFLQNGAQGGLAEHFIADALIPAATRRGMGPVGAWRVDIGPETPTLVVLIPSRQVEQLVTLDLDLARDAEFLKAADPFWAARQRRRRLCGLTRRCWPRLKAGRG